MKKKILITLMTLGMIMGMTACGSEDIKVVEKLPESETVVQEGSAQTAEVQNAESTAEEAILTGYIYEAEREDGKVSVTTDIEMAGVLEQLGEPVSYFEAASCAFEGLDKTYTYDHFRIETYPDGDTDVIASIIFLDDLTQTKEGISIGMTKEEMEETYGTDYEEKQGMLVYTKDGKHLSFLLEYGVIQSIEYSSAVTDTQ